MAVYYYVVCVFKQRLSGLFSIHITYQKNCVDGSK